MAKIKKWSAMLIEKEQHPSKVYREGAKFVYDSGDLPEGLIGVGVGCVLCLQKKHGISAPQMPGNPEDWIIVGGSGDSSGSTLVIDSTLSTSSPNPIQNRVVAMALQNLDTCDCTVDSKLSSTSANPLENRQIYAELNKKVDKVTGKQLSTEDFTTALKNKLSAIPVITINGNTLTIDGTAFTLTPAGGGGQTTTAKDYYVGWTNALKSAFAELSDAALLNLATGYMIDSQSEYSGAFGENNIFFLMYQASKEPSGPNNSSGITLTSGGQAMTQDIESDNTCPHNDVTVDGTTYKVFGIRLATGFDPADSMTVTFNS